MALKLCLSLAALREFRLGWWYPCWLFPSGQCVTSMALSVTGVVVVTSSGGCEMQVDVGTFPLSPADGGRNTPVWVGALDFGWKQKIHRLGGFESC